MEVGFFMPKKEALVENICEQVKRCLGNIKQFAVSDEHHLLKLESRHLDLLLDLLQSKISLSSYKDEFNTLFQNEGGHIYFDSYTPVILSFEKEPIENVYVDSEVLFFVNVLQICSDNIKKHIECKKYDAIKDEVYYNHNVPSLIFSKNQDLINYYLSVECTGCRCYCSKEMIQSYESIWQQIENTFSSDTAQG